LQRGALSFICKKLFFNLSSLSVGSNGAYHSSALPEYHHGIAQQERICVLLPERYLFDVVALSSNVAFISLDFITLDQEGICRELISLFNQDDVTHEEIKCGN